VTPGAATPMQFIRDIFSAARAAGRPVISFEFFPTKTEEGERTLLERTIPALGQLNPDFCSVTYGAGGSTREKTLMIVDHIQREQRMTTMAHLTCVNATAEQTRDMLDQARRLGVKNILALRGDPPDGGEFTMTDGGFEYSYQLVEFVRQAGGYSIGVAGFPEGHLACKEGKHVDWRRLKNKIDHGADFVITQLFFSNRDYLEFRSFRASFRSSARPRSSGSSRCAGLTCRRRWSPSWTSAATTTRPSPGSASSMRRRSARNCCVKACPAFTSTRSTRRDPRPRS
jgi:hypothetical protein